MREIPAAATGLLRTFSQAGMLDLPDVHLARRMSRGYENDARVVLAFALAVRELRLGSVCLFLSTAHTLKPLAEVDDGSTGVAEIALPWPEPDAWADAVARSRLVGHGCPFRFEDGRLYLARFYAQEQQVAKALAARRELPLSDDKLPVPAVGVDPDPDQDAAVAAALRHRTVVITGGPGTGKTTTVVRILASLAHLLGPVRVALAAPTGKAAQQLQSSVSARLDDAATGTTPFAGTLHRLLGKQGRGPASADADHLLPFEVVIVDEVSMVSLEMMGELLSAIAPTTRLVLVGDPNQLRSIEAGAVLADIVANPELTQPGSIVPLRTNRRSNTEILALSRAIDDGDQESVLTQIDSSATIDWVDYDGEGIDALPQLREDVLTHASRVIHAARLGDASAALTSLDTHRILCAHRMGPFGVQDWGRAARDCIATAVPGYGQGERYVGQPLMLTRNTDLFINGDVAVVIDDHGHLVAALGQPSAPVRLPPLLLEDATELHAMTIHKAQGSQYDVVSIVLPPVGSPLNTRELLYTAVTRAKSALRIYGTRDALREAVQTPVRRASGLATQAG